MPSLYNDGEYDMSGTIVGVVDKEHITDGKNINKGDILIGLKSSGLHTNGYSLARAVLFPKYRHDSYIQDLGATVGEALLTVHKSYYRLVFPLVELSMLKGISHITGGGIIGNTRRIMPEGRTLAIDWNSWEVPPIFNLIQSTGAISDDEMRKVFNLGIGMILIVDKLNADSVLDSVKSYSPFVIGMVE